MNYTKGLVYSLSTAALVAGGTAVAQESGDGEELRQQQVTVTGSFIAGTPEDAALPVDVVGRTELDDIGAPSINEILRNLPSAQGLIGETNQFDTRGGQGNEGASTINLRGLGSARTLVLLNGRRHVASDAIGVDVSFVPVSAIQRAEVLKDGAAALYGSDAIGGVVNFITRDDFEGVELRASHQFIEDSDGDSELSAIFGRDFGKLNLMLAAEYGRRGELNIKDRDWAFVPFASNPQGGFSSIGNPGTFVDFTPGPGATSIFNADPNCAALGGETGGPPFCRFRYTFFDNLVEETETVKLLGVGTYEFGEQTLRVEGAFSEVDIPEWDTSPAYPPQALLGADRAVLPDHPGRIAFFEANPDWAARFDPNEPILFWGRYTGVAGVDGGQPETAQRIRNQYRAAFNLSGPLFDGGVNYDLGVAYSSRRAKNEGNDMSVENSAFALRGLGGPDCDRNTGTPGVGPCEYYNPFSNAFPNSAVTGEANPFFDPSVANSDALLDWLVDPLFSTTENELLVADLIFNGDTQWSLPGGTIGYAVGAQVRREVFDFSLSGNSNLNNFPCPFTQQAAITQGFVTTLDCTGAETGLYAFLSGSFPSRFERSIYGGFFELALPFSDTFDVQVAGRFEDYGEENGGSTFDPKIAAKWQVTDIVALRGSVSTTFRGAPQSSLGGRFTSLAFVGPTTAFKAIDTIGNPDLEPEKALASNVGVLVNTGGFTGSLDYWRFDFSDPFQLESFDQIVSAYTANDCADGGAGVGSVVCESLRAQIFPLGTQAAGLTRIERQLINGTDITTDGVDFFGEYAWQTGNIDLSVGLTGTYTLSYESEDFLNRDGVNLAEGGDFVGFLNEGTPFQTLVELRGNIFARAATGPHTVTYNLRYTDDYEDVAPSVPELGKIDSQVTHDITYNLSLFDGNTRLSASVFNLTDEDPPQASTDLNYDPYTHNPFGRMFKIGITQQF
ncbi:MAG: TonB-dependent receptor [Pseudomonadota bacterium]